MLGLHIRNRKNKKEKSPWLKAKKKMGPKKKKKVFNKGWQKSLAETNKSSWLNHCSFLFFYFSYQHFVRECADRAVVTHSTIFLQNVNQHQ